MCAKAFKNCLVFSVVIICLVYAPQSKADRKEKYAISIMQDELNKLDQTQRHIRHRRHKSLEIENVPDYIIPLVDMSCISQGMVKAPPIKNGKVARYIHKKLPLSITAKENEHKGFLVAMYSCLDGYEFETNENFKMYCSKRKWIGKKPKCLKINSESYELNDDAIALNAGILSNSINCSREFRKNCEQDCIIENEEPICICYTGYILLENKCIDINECDNENIRRICKNGCVNTQGSYHCIPSDVSFEKRKEYVDNNTGIHYVPDKIYDESVEDEESSGSGDYTDENYSEENNENEDDEDYLEKSVYKNDSYLENKKESDDVQPILEEESTTPNKDYIKNNNTEIEENNQKNNFLTETSFTNFITTTESYIKETTYLDKTQLENIENKENDKLDHEKETSGNKRNINTEIESTTEFFPVTEVSQIDKNDHKEEENINTDTTVNNVTSEPNNFSVTNKEFENSDDFKFQIKAITPSNIVHINKEDIANQINKTPNENASEESDGENDNEDDDYYNEVDYNEEDELEEEKLEEEKENKVISTTIASIDNSKTVLTTETHPETTEAQSELSKNNTNLIENTYDRGDDDYYNAIDYDETNYNLEKNEDKVIHVLQSTSFKTPTESVTESFQDGKEQYGDVTILTENKNMNTIIKKTEFTTPAVFEKHHNANEDVDDKTLSNTVIPYTIIPTEVAVSVVSDTPHDLTTENSKKQTDFEVVDHIESDDITTLTPTISITINNNNNEEYDENHDSTTVESNESHPYHENKLEFSKEDKDDDYKEENYLDNDGDSSTSSTINFSHNTKNYPDKINNEDNAESYYYENHNETTTISNTYSNSLNINKISKNIEDEKNEKDYKENNIIETNNNGYDTNESSHTVEESKDKKDNETYNIYSTSTPIYDDDVFSKPTEENIPKSVIKKEYDEEENIVNNAHHENKPSHSEEDDDYKEDYEENYGNHNYDNENYAENEYDDKEVQPTTSSSNDINPTDMISSPCPQGFFVTESNCEDINECQESNNGNCSHECENTIGSYRCLCPLGYTVSFENQHLCLDVDECIHQPCSHQCINEIGSFRCDCPKNYYLLNQTTCLEVICSYDFIKLNNSIQCICPTGFILGKDNYTCEDIDECISSDIHNCSQICENVEGSFVCLCEEGYLLQNDSFTCEDLNECEDVTLNDCFQICDNVNGSFNCACFDGYQLTNDTHCQDVDECAYGNGNCSHICFNGEGFHECLCPDNFYLMDDTKNCKLLNPCELNNGGCSNICVNDNGNAICICPDGYEIVNDHCILIDKCNINNGECSHFCKNDEGIISCNCPHTHTLANETHCEEIDQCTINNGNCSHICTWYENQVTCSCPDEYDLIDNKSCFQRDLCKIYNEYCSHICTVTNNEIECECPVNYKLTNKTICVEMDMCEIDNGGCSHDCFHDDKNQIQCGCPQNYELQYNKTCVEINPCLINNGGCSHECSYENASSVTCLCPENHILNERTCHLVDPCKTDNGGCSHICENVHGEAFCRCPPRLKMINRFCLEVNPCAMKNGGCSHFCTNINGTAQCSCPVGYKIRPNKRNCKEINYCRPNNGGCSHGCKNVRGSYECTCPNGYLLSNNNNTCLDTNECLNSNGGCEQLCINLDGSYKCACREEYRLETNRRSCKAVHIGMCPALVPPQNGNVRCMKMYPNEKNVVPIGTQCLVWCEVGYKLRGESIKSCNSLGNWGNQPSYCIAVSCPKLGSVAKGHFTPESCINTRLFPGEMCSLKCNQGYKPSREFETITCLSSLKWSSIVSESRLENACTEDTFEPYIRCPKGGSLTYTLPLGKNQMLVTIPKPDSNVDWRRYVSSKPSWGMELTKNLSPGRTDVIYSARSPVTNNTVSCRLIITVVDKEVPQVINCPNNIEYRLSPHEYNKVVYWSEPEFTDNVKIVGVYKSREPGTKFRMGIHYVYYIAHDESGNQAKCYFSINIKASSTAESRSANDQAVLICPHGIRYISKSSEMYKNEALKQEGCYWGNTRPRKPRKEHNFEIHSKNVLSDSGSKRYQPFYWYNRCC